MSILRESFRRKRISPEVRTGEPFGLNEALLGFRGCDGHLRSAGLELDDIADLKLFHSATPPEGARGGLQFFRELCPELRHEVVC